MNWNHNQSLFTSYPIITIVGLKLMILANRWRTAVEAEEAKRKKKDGWNSRGDFLFPGTNWKNIRKKDVGFDCKEF